MLPLPDRGKQGDAALGYNQPIALPRSIALVRSPVELVFPWSGPGNDYARSLEKSGVSAPAPLPDRG